MKTKTTIRISCVARVSLIAVAVIIAGVVSAATPNDGRNNGGNQPLQAQAKAPYELNLDKPIDLQVTGDIFAAMRSFCAASGVPVIADAPAAAVSSRISANGSVRSVLDKLCEAFGYKWSVVAGRIVILTRKFARPEEIPQANLAELRTTASDMLKILPPADVDLADPHRPWSNMLKQLSDQLTAEQVAALKNKSTISCVSLPPAQQGMIARIINARVYGAPRAFWYRLCILLGGSGPAVLTARTAPGGLRHLYLVGHSPGITPIELRIGVLPAATEINPSAEPRASVPVTEDPKEARKTGDSPRTPVTDPLDQTIDASMRAATMGELAKELSRQSGTHIDTVEGIAGHRIHACVTNVACRIVLDAVSALGNWRWNSIERDRYRVMRWPARVRNDPEQVSRAMQKALPHEFLDYLGIDAWEKRSPDERFMIQTAHESPNGLDRVKTQVLQAVAPRLAKSNEILVQALPEETQNQIAFLVFFDRFQNGAPPLFNGVGVQVIEPRNCYLLLEANEILCVQTRLRPDYPVGFGTNVVNRK